MNEADKKSFMSYLDLLVEKNIGYYSDEKKISGKYDYKKSIKKEEYEFFFSQGDSVVKEVYSN